MTVRLALTLLVAVPAAMAYPWPSDTQRWLHGVAVVVLLALWIRWRGVFLTTLAARRIALWWRNLRGAGRAGEPAHLVTVVLRAESAVQAELPLPLIAGYVDRYGIRCDKVRVTHRDRSGDRSTWISVTLGAVENLAALRARSPRIPLRQTAALTARRLADQLREGGWDVRVIDEIDEVELPVPCGSTETWRGMRDEQGCTAAYAVTVDDQLAERLASAATHPADEVWTVLEITGAASKPELAVGCALRTASRSPSGSPVPGLVPQRGRHRRALDALHPQSCSRLEAKSAAVGRDLLDGLGQIRR